MAAARAGTQTGIGTEFTTLFTATELGGLQGDAPREMRVTNLSASGNMKVRITAINGAIPVHGDSAFGIITAGQTREYLATIRSLGLYLGAVGKLEVCAVSGTVDVAWEPSIN